MGPPQAALRWPEEPPCLGQDGVLSSSQDKARWDM